MDTRTGPAGAIEQGGNRRHKIGRRRMGPAPHDKVEGNEAVVAVSRLENRRGARFDERNRTEPQKGSGTMPDRVGRPEEREMTQARSTHDPHATPRKLGRLRLNQD